MTFDSPYHSVYSTLKENLVGITHGKEFSFTPEVFDAMFPLFALRVEIDGIPKDDALVAIRLGQDDLSALETQQKLSHENLKKAVDSMPLVECMMHFDAENILRLRAEPQIDDIHSGKLAGTNIIDSYSLSTATRSIIYGSEKSTTNHSNLCKIIKYLPPEVFIEKSGSAPKNNSFLDYINNSDLFDNGTRSEILIELLRHHAEVARSLGKQSVLIILNSAIARGKNNIDQLVENGLGKSFYIDRTWLNQLSSVQLPEIHKYLSKNILDENLISFIHDPALFSAEDPRSKRLFKFLEKHPEAIRSLEPERVLQILNLAISTNQNNVDILVDCGFKNSVYTDDYFRRLLADSKLSEIREFLAPILVEKTEGNLIRF